MLDLHLFLFTTNPDLARRAIAAGVDGLVVDWEFQDKHARQAQVDTQINNDTPDDLRRLRALTTAPILCRINGYGPTTAGEIEEAIAGGASEILLPMVRKVEHVEAALRHVAGRCGLGILVETVESAREAERLGRLPLSRVFVGLNDLAIERRSPSLFAPLADGTMESIRPRFPMPFGFGGLTLPDLGRPIPCRLLMGEMARLGCGFSFLRRSFLADTRGRDLAVEVPRMREAVRAAFRRSPGEVARDRADLLAAVASIPGAGAR